MWLGVAIIYPRCWGSSRSYDRDRQKNKEKRNIYEQREATCMLYVYVCMYM